MKTALFTLVALAGLAMWGNPAQAQVPNSHSAPIQLAGHGHRGYHGGHHGGYHRGHGHYQRYHHGHGYHGGYGHGGYYRDHGHHHHYGYPSYGYRRGGGIGFSGRNFSFYYGF